MTGEMWLTGDADRPPVRLSVPQLFTVAGVEAAVHTIVGLWHADTTGEGQHVDVSAQLCGVKFLMNAQTFHILEGRELFRYGPYYAAGPSFFRAINPCLDGHAVALVAAGPIGGAMMRFIMDWADAEGVADPAARDRDYSTLNFLDEPEEFFAAVPRHDRRVCSPATRRPSCTRPRSTTCCWWRRSTPWPTSGPTNSSPRATTSSPPTRASGGGWRGQARGRGCRRRR